MFQHYALSSYALTCALLKTASILTVAKLWSSLHIIETPNYSLFVCLSLFVLPLHKRHSARRLSRRRQGNRGRIQNGENKSGSWAARELRFTRQTFGSPPKHASANRVLLGSGEVSLVVLRLSLAALRRPRGTESTARPFGLGFN